MALFVSDAKERELNLCHLLYTNISDKELMNNYGYAYEEIEQAKEDLSRFDDYQYCRGNLRKAFRRKQYLFLTFFY